MGGNNDICGTCLLGSSDGDLCGGACIFGCSGLLSRACLHGGTSLRRSAFGCLFCSPSDHCIWRIRCCAGNVWGIGQYPINWRICYDAEDVRLDDLSGDAMTFTYAQEYFSQLLFHLARLALRFMLFVAQYEAFRARMFRLACRGMSAV